ncbi:hypothetical protein ACNHE5_15720 [Pandoraea pnomenusa]|uniref:hypothetical protein n=1 Tax=Pandoraea TaxID=93217 RepID=UPI000A3E05DB|nr:MULTISPECIES: hypothetical protein [Pandoraea]QDH58648.1 hypothetical protein FKQ53_04635 [Pandoraea pnomenusa]
MKKNTSHYCELERLLRESLAMVVSDISDQDRNDVHEYLEHGEYGVAYELLEFVIGKQGVARPTALVEAGKRMGMNRPGFGGGSNS